VLPSPVISRAKVHELQPLLQPCTEVDSTRFDRGRVDFAALEMRSQLAARRTSRQRAAGSDHARQTAMASAMATHRSRSIRPGEADTPHLGAMLGLRSALERAHAAGQRCDLETQRATT
jgi:hypothetical protein